MIVTGPEVAPIILTMAPSPPATQTAGCGPVALPNCPRAVRRDGSTEYAPTRASMEGKTQGLGDDGHEIVDRVSGHDIVDNWSLTTE